MKVKLPNINKNQFLNEIGDISRFVENQPTQFEKPT
jgi:hypothetical protein